MNLVELASHTVDLDAIPERPTVLDVGCRGFGFGRAIQHHRPRAYVVAMDPDPELPLDNMPDGTVFIRKALVGDGRTESKYAAWSNGDGNMLCTTPPWYADKTFTVPCCHITELMQHLGITYWDVVKLDCEESEFGILENWPGPIAGQLSVEFHDWTGACKVKATEDYYRRLFAGPLRDYDVLSHELSTVGPGPAWGHWDSVFRLKRHAD